MIHVAFCNIQCLQVLVYMSLHMIAVHLVMEVSYPALPPNHPVMDDHDWIVLNQPVTAWAANESGRSLGNDVERSVSLAHACGESRGSANQRSNTRTWSQWSQYRDPDVQWCMDRKSIKSPHIQVTRTMLEIDHKDSIVTLIHFTCS